MHTTALYKLLFAHREQQATNGPDESRAGIALYSLSMAGDSSMLQLETKISSELATLKQGIETMEKVFFLNESSRMNYKCVLSQEIQIYNDITTLKANEEAKKEVL